MLVKKTKTEDTKTEKKTGVSSKKKIVKKPSLKKKLKPFMDYLGIINFHPIKLDYYKGNNEIYLIEADYLETFVLKIYAPSADRYAASIEKHFVTNAKNISKLTPNVNVAHDKDDKLPQFFFTDRRPGALKKMTGINSNDKSQIIKDVAKIMFKFHTYTSKKTLKKDVYGKVYDTHKTWNSYLKTVIDKKIKSMEEAKTKKSEILKFQKDCESKLAAISTHKIEPSLLHGSISLNNANQIRSLLFLRNKVSSIINFEESIYGDHVWDLVFLHDQLFNKNKELEKDFFNVYGKLKDEEKERLDFYKKIIL